MTQWRALLRRALQINRAEMNWRTSLRRAVIVGACLVTGVLTGRVELGLSVGFGALMVGIQDRYDSYPRRVSAMLLGMLASVPVVLVAGLSNATPVWKVVAAMTVAFLSGLSAGWGPRIGAAGTAALKPFAVAGAFVLTAPEAVVSTLCFAAGGLLQISVVLVAWAIRGGSDVRMPVAEAWREAGGAAVSDPGRRQWEVLRTTVDRARTAVEVLPKDSDLAKTLQRLTRDVAEVEAGIRRYQHRRKRPDHDVPAERWQAVADACHAIARAIHVQFWAPRAHAAIDAATGDSGRTRDAESERIDRALSDAGAAISSLHRPERRGGDWDRQIGAPLFSGRPDFAWSSPVLQEAIRLSATFGLATLIGVLWGNPHSYWIAMTVAVVSMPGYVLSISRTVARTIGTLAAVAAIGLVSWTAPGPEPLIMVAILAAAGSFIFYVAFSANYAIASFGISSAVLLMATLAGSPTDRSALIRTVATMVGGGIVVAGALIRPRRSAPALAGALAAYADSLSEYLDSAAGQDPDAVLAAARKCRLQHTRADRTLDDAWAEPGGRGLPPEAGQEILNHLVEVSLYGTDVFDGETPRGPDDVQAVRHALGDLATAMRSGTAIAEPPHRKHSAGLTAAAAAAAAYNRTLSS